MNKNIFVTGANGWIGLEVTKYLLEENYVVKALVREKNTEIIQLTEKYTNLYVIEGELENQKKWNHEIEGCNTLIHLAAKVHSYVKSKNDVNEYDRINYEATKNLFLTAEKFNIQKSIFVSTVASMDLDESELNLPQFAYARSKKKAEQFLEKMNQKSSMQILIVRPVTLYGGNDKGNFKRLFRISNYKLFPILGDGLNKKSIIYYKDFARSLVNISISNIFEKEIITIGTEEISILDIAYTFRKFQSFMVILKIPKVVVDSIKKVLLVFKLKNLSIIKQMDTLTNSNVYSLTEGKKYLPINKTLFQEVNFNEEYKD